MQKSLFFLFIVGGLANADIVFYTWNLKHLGRDKQRLDKVADILAGGEMIVLQEVNTTKSGATKLQELAKLMEERSKARFCMGWSEIPTDANERYAMLWREKEISYVTTKGEIKDDCPEFGVTLRLGQKGADKILREPAMGIFYEKDSKEKFLAASVHLVPDDKKPAEEVPYLFDSVDEGAQNLPVILGGDFNLSASNPSFEAATKLKFTNVFPAATKTSLKIKVRELSRSYDNIFLRNAKAKESAVINLHNEFKNIEASDIYYNISDHCPLKAVVDIAPLK